MTEAKETKTTRGTGARKTIKEKQEEVVATIVEESTVDTENEKTVGIIAVDNGGDNTKVFSEDMEFPIYFKSEKKRGQKRDLLEPPIVDSKSEHSFIIKWKEKVYLTNRRTRLAKYNDSMTGNVALKSNDYFILSALIGVALYGYDVNYLVTSIPYEHRFEKDANEKIKQSLTGHHSLEIDGELYEFEIVHVWLSIEAQAGHFYLQEEGVTTLLEIGSRTVGYATNELVFNSDGTIAIDQPILEKTGTLARKGVQISDIDETDFEEYELYVNDIYGSLSKKIDENDKIVAFGGGVLVEPIQEALSQVYHNISFADEPLFVQVRGMLEMGKLAYETEFGEESDE